MTRTNQSSKVGIPFCWEMGNLVVVSNRLPVNISKEDEKWTYCTRSGSLVSILTGAKRSTPFKWIGYLDVDVPPEEQTEVRELLEPECLIPVFLERKTADLYYADFANGVIWPAFHYYPEAIHFTKEAWDAYVAVNKAFAATVCAHAKTTDLVWVHDYHLMLLPKLIKERVDVNIGFFLHILFPPCDVYTTLPVARVLLESVLASDLIGFHTVEYTRNFLCSASQLFGLITKPQSIVMEDGREVRVDTFPVGIDPEKFHVAVSQPSVKKLYKSLRKSFGSKKLILGVDRMDYIKGIPLKLLAYKSMLKSHPELVNDTVLLQIAVPSRESVAEYEELAHNCNELVGQINGTVGTLSHVPIHLYHKSVDFETLVALYLLADVCVISSIRDGMNLVASEFVASQCKEDPGVLVLSEFTGVSASLSGAIIINPWNIDEMANSMYVALHMDLKQRKSSYESMIKYVRSHTSMYWGNSFIKELDQVARSRAIFNTEKLDKSLVRSGNTLLLIWIDGLLASHKELEREHINALLQGSGNFAHSVYLVSNASEEQLGSRFVGVNVGLIAKNGAFVKKISSDEWVSLYEPVSVDWKTIVMPWFVHYVERTPGAFVEEEETRVLFNYKGVDPEFGLWQANDLMANLEPSVSHLPIRMARGRFSVECYLASVSITSAIDLLVKSGDFQSVLVVSPNFEEDLLLYCHSLENCKTIVVGKYRKTRAEFFIDTLSELFE